MREQGWFKILYLLTPNLGVLIAPWFDQVRPELKSSDEQITSAVC